MTHPLSRSEAERNAVAIVYFDQASQLGDVDLELSRYLEECGLACLAYDAVALLQWRRRYKNRIEELMEDRETA